MIKKYSPAIKTIILYFKNILYPISREYKFFSLLFAGLIFFLYFLFAIFSYRNYQNDYNQKYKFISSYIANDYEIFLDNIFRQTEFIGHKIENKNDLPFINSLLKRRFSVDIDLDTSLLKNWIMIKWLDSDGQVRVTGENGVIKRTLDSQYNTILASTQPWKIHFFDLHSYSPGADSKYIPIIFGIKNEEGAFLGSLAANINTTNIVSYLNHNQENKEINFVILDKKNNIIAESFRAGSNSNSNSLPDNFFKNEKFLNQSGNISKKFDLKNALYLGYTKLNNYPFTIVVGNDKDLIYGPLLHNLANYLLFSILISLVVTILLFFFHRKIIAPIYFFSDFAGSLTISNAMQALPEKYLSPETIGLAKSLLRIDRYKKKMINFCRRLKSKNDYLTLSKLELETELKKLIESYKIQKTILQSNESEHICLSPEKVIAQSVILLYPEIHLRKLKISENYQVNLEFLPINHKNFVKIIAGLLYNSLIFSGDNAKIAISTNSYTSTNNNQYFQVVVEDEGIGNQSWRKEYLKNKYFNNENQADFTNIIYDMNIVELLIASNNATLDCIDNQRGVKYCLNFLIETKKLENYDSKIVQFPRNPNKRKY